MGDGIRDMFSWPSRDGGGRPRVMGQGLQFLSLFRCQHKGRPGTANRHAAFLPYPAARRTRPARGVVATQGGHGPGLPKPSGRVVTQWQPAWTAPVPTKQICHDSGFVNGHTCLSRAASAGSPPTPWSRDIRPPLLIGGRLPLREPSWPIVRHDVLSAARVDSASRSSASVASGRAVLARPGDTRRPAQRSASKGRLQNEERFVAAAGGRDSRRCSVALVDRGIGFVQDGDRLQQRTRDALPTCHRGAE